MESAIKNKNNLHTPIFEINKMKIGLTRLAIIVGLKEEK